MKNRRKNGVRRRNVGDKAIVSNRSTGNTGHRDGNGKLKRSQAMARLKKD